MLFSVKSENDLSTVAVETGKLANIVSSLRMFGKQSALQTSSDDSESHGFLLKHWNLVALSSTKKIVELAHAYRFFQFYDTLMIGLLKKFSHKTGGLSEF